MNIRDRIVELKRVKARELRANPANWRTHPEAQRGALSAILEDIGFVGAVIARQLERGKLEILDGHLRADIADDAEIPVLVTDLTADEANKLLLTYDPIGAAAEADMAKLDALIGLTKLPDHADLRKLVSDLEFSGKSSGSSSAQDFEVEGMALKPHGHYDYIVVLASTTHDWNNLCDRLGISSKKRNRKRSMGIARAIRAEKLLSMLPSQSEKPKKSK